MSKDHNNLYLYLISLVLFAGCGFYHSKIAEPSQAEIKARSASYSKICESVIYPNCVSCHNQAQASGGVILDTYAAVKANLGEVENDALIEKTMPPKGPLSSGDQKILRSWITRGAPQYEVSAPDPNAPVPSPTPALQLKATYASIRELVLVPKCLNCHGVGGKAYAKVPFENYEQLMKGNTIRKGDPENSTFYSQMELGKMPTKKSGLAKVSPADLQIISQWISIGASP